jgi:hypothetical protein
MKVRRSFFVLFIILVSSAGLAAQDSAMERVVTEATRLRQNDNARQPDFEQAMKGMRDQSAGLNDALRDWVELRLPSSKGSLESELPLFQSRLNAELWRAGALAPESTEVQYGYVSRLEVSRPAEFPEGITITIGISVPCGVYDSVYVYDYRGGAPRRVLESRGTREHDENISDIYFSRQDAIGSRLILTLRYAVQCGSSWNGLSYDLFRFSADSNIAVPVFSGEHGIWFVGDEPYHVRLKPDELLIELRDRSIDSSIHNRTHVLRYSIGSLGVQRVDPVALQPQDFVDEWLSRPWPEMASRSSGTEREKLKEWHEFLSGDIVAGDIDFVQSCSERPDDWQVSVSLRRVAGKRLPEPFTLYFLVHRLEKYRFEMAEISFDEQDGCPGESPPSTDRPSLFEKNSQVKEITPVAPM